MNAMSDRTNNFSEAEQTPVIRIVDDDEMMLGSWVFFLEGEGRKVRAYTDAVEFVEKDNFEDPGCLLLDVRMPHMSGLELQELMGIKGINLPIVFVSGHGEIDMVVHALKHGACDFLQKPVDERRLLAALDSATQKDLAQRSKTKKNSDQLRTLRDSYGQGKRGCFSCRNRLDEQGCCGHDGNKRENRTDTPRSGL